MDFAEPLVVLGVTPRLFGDLATHAFVHAACKVSKLRNGRVNQSRVAVLTGLHRAEVKKLISGSRLAGPTMRIQRPRSERVIHGWISEPRYLDGVGRPRRLPIAGRVSFTSLAKQFAGDVPYRAVLEELRRMRVVQQEGRYLRLTAARARSNEQLQSKLLELFPILFDGIQLARSERSPLDYEPFRRLTLRARDLVEFAILKERTLSGADSFLDGLKQSLENPSRLAKQSKKTKHDLTVTILLNEKHGATNVREHQ